MAKGFMIFVEGGYSPKVVHRKINTAWQAMHRAAEANPGSEVMLLQLHKRIVRIGQDTQIMGTHFLNEEKHKVDKCELVRKEDIHV